MAQVCKFHHRTSVGIEGCLCYGADPLVFVWLRQFLSRERGDTKQIAATAGGVDDCQIGLGIYKLKSYLTIKIIFCPNRINLQQCFIFLWRGFPGGQSIVDTNMIILRKRMYEVIIVLITETRDILAAQQAQAQQRIQNRKQKRKDANSADTTKGSITPAAPLARLVKQSE